MTMFSLLAVLPLLSLALAEPPTTKLDLDAPIYLGNVFWPPTMTFIAWQSLDPRNPLDWCTDATDATNHRLFTLGGVGGLQIQDYFEEAASISREGKTFAKCKITPETGQMGACSGVLDYDCLGGQKLTGPGTRKWSCWVVDEERERLTGSTKKQAVPGEQLMGVFTPTVTAATPAKSSPAAAFTPGDTGS